MVYTTEKNSRRLSMIDFIRELKGHIDRGFLRDEVHAFLSETLISEESLEEYVRFEEGRYTRHLIFKSPEVEVLVLCWDIGQTAPVHGHEGELCWARVERGRLRFANYREVSAEPLVVAQIGNSHDGGSGFLDGPADIHSVENPTEFAERAVSLHIYSKPFAECDIYHLDDARVRRVSMKYDFVAELQI